MRGFEIIGTGHFVPGKPVSNHDLSRVMDTNDEWIFRRTGIRRRHYAPEGVGASDLAAEAGRRAIEAAGISREEIDYVIFATMTPDYVFPGPGALVAHKLGLNGVPALDIRQQCAAMLFGLQIIDALVKSGAARTILYVAAEAHAGFMPWSDWGALEGAPPRAPEEAARASAHRGVAVLFGDGAGALVVRATDRDAGLRGVKLHSDGSHAKLLYIEGAGFRSRPFIKPNDHADLRFVPTMDGRGLFDFAANELPRCARELCVESGTPLEAIDWFLAHQANARINEIVREQLGVAAEKFPSNIDRFGNTSAATIPILVDERSREGQLRRGDLCMVLALGAGVHWGCALVRW